MLFRQDVIEAARDRLEGTVIAATPPRAATYLFIALGVLIAMIALLTFGSFATKVRVTGVVSYGGGVARVYTSSPVEIRALHVREGDIVAAGAPLATVSVTQGRNANGDGMHSQIAELERQDGELARQQQLAQSSSGIDVEGLAQQRESLTFSIASLDRQQKLGALQLALSQTESGRAVRLAKQGAGSSRQAEAARAAAIQHELDVEALKERTISQRETLRQIDVQLAQRRLGSEQKISEIAAQRAALAEQRAALQRLDRLVLTAPVAGRVSDLVVAVGQRARPETSLMTVVPTGSTLEVWLYAPSRAVGFVRPGDQVRLMFDAFPFQKYGAGTGTVIALSSIPTDPGAIATATGLAIQEPVYRIRVRIDRAAGRDAIGHPLRSGMTLSANLITEHRRLWEVFLDPILRSWRQ
jgi:membrane fusion protein